MYHLDALRLADGFGYTTTFASSVAVPNANHPPAWVTVLGLVSWLGGRSLVAHQLTGMAIGLLVVLVAGLVGRRYFTPEVGVIALFAAAIYPGFWILEAQVLSEPLGVLCVGAMTLAAAELRDRPTFGRSVMVGILCGATALTRSEQLALLALVALPGIARADGLHLLLPLTAPLLIATAIAAIAFGDPRYHVIADLGVIVLAAFGAEDLRSRFRRDGS